MLYANYSNKQHISRFGNELFTETNPLYYYATLHRLSSDTFQAGDTSRGLQKYLFIYAVVKQSTGQSIRRGALESRAGLRGYLSTFILFPRTDKSPKLVARRGTRTVDINEADSRLFAFFSATKFRLRHRKGASLQFKRYPGRG